MSPFNVSEHLSPLRGAYLDISELVAAASCGSNERNALARLWISEGIPFAFRNHPALYDHVRCWLAARLSVEPKEISLVGSGRLGQSLSRNRRGEPFSEASDLDFMSVSEKLFDQLRDEFLSWASDYENDRVHPRHPTERKYWDQNRRQGSINLKRGFLNSNFIPTWRRYPASQRLADTMSKLVEGLKVTENGVVVKHADLRAYKNWAAYLRQMDLSLSRLG